MTELDTPPSTPTTSGHDPRPLLARALDQTGGLIAGTDPADATRPTPCDEYDVATLVAHLQAVVRRIGAVVRGEPFFTVPLIWPSSDWTADWTAGRADTDVALAAADLDRVVQLPWGEASIRAAVGSYVGELATHGWDLAVATGRRHLLDEEIAAIALPASVAKVPGDHRGEAVPFGPVVPVPEDAPPTDRLVGWLGRDPSWQG